MDWLSSIAGRHGCVLVAHNAKNFDSIVLNKNLWKTDIDIPFDLSYADSIDIMRKIQEKGELCMIFTSLNTDTFGKSCNT